MRFGLLSTTDNEELVWRLPVAFQGFYWIFTAVCPPFRLSRRTVLSPQATIFFLPESPRWLYAQGYIEAATNVLARVYDEPEHSQLVLDTYAALKAEVDDEERREDKGFALFIQCIRAMFWDTTDLKLGRRLRLCFLIMMLQEMSGLNIVRSCRSVSLMI